MSYSPIVLPNVLTDTVVLRAKHVDQHLNVTSVRPRPTASSNLYPYLNTDEEVNESWIFKVKLWLDRYKHSFVRLHVVSIATTSSMDGGAAGRMVRDVVPPPLPPSASRQVKVWKSSAVQPSHVLVEFILRQHYACVSCCWQANKSLWIYEQINA